MRHLAKVIGFTFAGAIGLAAGANATPIVATVTSPLTCGGGVCTYTATATGLTDMQADFLLPQWGSAGTPSGVTITGMSVSFDSSFTTTGTITASATGAGAVYQETRSVITTMGPGTVSPPGFQGLGGNSPSDVNFQLTSPVISAFQFVGDMAPNATASVNFTSAPQTFAALNTIDPTLIG